MREVFINDYNIGGEEYFFPENKFEKKDIELENIEELSEEEIKNIID